MKWLAQIDGYAVAKKTQKMEIRLNISISMLVFSQCCQHDILVNFPECFILLWRYFINVMSASFNELCYARIDSNFIPA